LIGKYFDQLQWSEHVFPTVSFDMLKTIQQIVTGYEVEQCLVAGW